MSLFLINRTAIYLDWRVFVTPSPVNIHVYFSSELADKAVLIGRRDLEHCNHSRINVYAGNTLFFDPYFEQTTDSSKTAYLA